VIDPAHSDALDEHLEALRQRERYRHSAALLRDLASRQSALLDAGRTGRDVIDAIRDEAAYLERAATRIDQTLRSLS